VKPNTKKEMHYQNDCDDKEHDAEAQSNGHRPIPIMWSATAIAPTKMATFMRNRQDSDISCLQDMKGSTPTYMLPVRISNPDYIIHRRVTLNSYERLTRQATGPANGDLREIGAALGRIVKGWGARTSVSIVP
jgi:hypothetical protein